MTKRHARSTRSTAVWATTSGAARRAPSTAANTAPASTASAARASPPTSASQLKAKQKLKGYYGNISEKQFRGIYYEARPPEGRHLCAPT